AAGPERPRGRGAVRDGGGAGGGGGVWVAGAAGARRGARGSDGGGALEAHPAVTESASAKATGRFITRASYEPDCRGASARWGESADPHWLALERLAVESNAPRFDASASNAEHARPFAP